MMKYISLGFLLMAGSVNGMARVHFAEEPDDKTHHEEQHREGIGAAQASLLASINPNNVTLSEGQYNGLSARVSQDAAKIVGQKAVRSIEMKAYRYREALLPALVTWSLDIPFGDYISKKIEKVSEFYRDVKDIAHKLPGKAILSVMLLSKKNIFFPLDLKYFGTDYTKTIGRKLCQNEVAIIGYADGSHEIQLSDIDRDIANNLSHEQLDCIVELHRSKDVSWLIKFKWYEDILTSLPLNMQRALSANYKVNWYVREYFSAAQQQYEKMQEDIEEAKRVKFKFETEKAKIKEEILDAEHAHWRDMQKAEEKERSLQEERNNRPFWKRHGRIMLATVAAFAVGWLGKSYWSSISSGISSWFSALKSKYSRS